MQYTIPKVCAAACAAAALFISLLVLVPGGPDPAPDGPLLLLCLISGCFLCVMLIWILTDLLRIERACCDDTANAGAARTDSSVPHLSVRTERARAAEQRRMRQLQIAAENAVPGSSEYLALQHQINPHFFYNLLDIIRGKVMLGERESASDLIESTGTFLRYSISNLDSLVPVSEEVSLLQTYIELQQIRFDNRLKITISGADDPVVRRVLLPKMTLQPLVENAVQHGFLDATRSCEIRISFHPYNGDLLIIHVQDNGSGMDTETLKALNYAVKHLAPEQSGAAAEHRGSIGLRNVARRIRLVYGIGYGLTVYSRLEGGTRISVRIPLNSKGYPHEE